VSGNVVGKEEGKEQQLGGPLSKIGKVLLSFKISETDFVEQTSL
jgi:hypothetical protein